MKTVLSLLTALVVSASALFAQPQQSADFRITKSVLDGGGGHSSSPSFQLTSALGQPTPIGWQSSANFMLSAGFLKPSFAVSPLSSIQRLVIRYISPNIRLDWERIATATLYTVFRDTTASFTPGPPNQIGTSVDTFYVDLNAEALPRAKYFYNVESSQIPPASIATTPAITPRGKSGTDLHRAVAEVPDKLKPQPSAKRAGLK
jgi:hypothetical protein